MKWLVPLLVVGAMVAIAGCTDYIAYEDDEIKCIENGASDHVVCYDKKSGEKTCEYSGNTFRGGNRPTEGCYPREES